MTDGFDGPAYVSVAIPVPVRRNFTYSVPLELRQSLAVGHRVRVAFGPRQVVGTVVGLHCDEPTAGIAVKPVLARVEQHRELPAEVLDLARFVAGYYLCSLGDAIEAALPPDPGAPNRLRIAMLLPHESLPTRDSGPILPAGSDSESPDRLSGLKSAPAQRALVVRMRDSNDGIRLSAMTAAELRALRELVRKNLARVVEQTVELDEDEPETPAQAVGHEPTAGQASALQQIHEALVSDRFQTLLLFGSTGSGKTEVYFRAAAEVLSQGRGVIYLVPEIGLTPLLIGKVHERFPGQAVVLHSGLRKRERFDAWRALKEGRRRIVVGTRSAIFAPIDNPGLIIVDEEQDGSYKQDESPRYNGRDLALVRGKSSGATVLLGSATPSMESFYRADIGRYRRIDLGGRVDDRPLPEVERVDMREEYERVGEIVPISKRLIERLAECVGRGEQALVLRNRRGWSTALTCPTCGDRTRCTRCDVSMTWHRSENRLRCHYCDASQRRPEVCATCGCKDLQLLGEGSEQIESLIAAAVPGARVQRMDRDSIRKRGAHEAMLRSFDAGEIDILVGTQMIAKGHDFHRVTLVGVLSADQSLGIPDFRAGERTFQLLTQVAGRAGRGRLPGHVVVQAYEPDHPLLIQAAAQDYEQFYRREIHYRKTLGYPPVSALIRIVIRHPDEFQARNWGRIVGEALRRHGDDRQRILGPGPAPMARIGGLHREQILVRGPARRRLVKSVDASLREVEGEVPTKAMQVDVDPYSLL